MILRTWYDETHIHRVESYEEFAAKVRTARDEPRKGVFAHSPDPIVFGPDTLRFTTPYTMDYKLDDRYYIKEYRRSDYPDWPSLW